MPSNPAMGYVAMSKESSAGTAITSPTHFYPFQQVDIEMDDELIEWQEIRRSRQAKQAVDGPLRPSVTLSGAVYPEGVAGHILMGLFGAKDSALVGDSETCYKHVFKDGAVLPTYTIERSTGASGESGVFAQRIAGCKVESFGLDLSFGEQVQFNAALQSFKVPTSVTPVSSGGISFPTIKPLYFQGATIEVGGVANSQFKSMNIEFNNTLERQETLNGTRIASSIFEGPMEVTFSGTLTFDSETMLDALLAGTEMSVELACTNGQEADGAESLNYEFGVEMPRTRIVRHSTPFSAGETLEADVEFKVLYDPSELTAAIPYLQNLDAGTVY